MWDIKPNDNKYSASGVYKLTCLDCNKSYIGQSDRSFLKRYNEHRLSFKNNSTV